MDNAARERGRKFIHYLQTNLISYSAAWNDVIHQMFNGSVGTSMDYPNVHRKLFKGGPEAYTKLWTKRLREARGAGIKIGVIAELHGQGSLLRGLQSRIRSCRETRPGTLATPSCLQWP